MGMSPYNDPTYYRFDDEYNVLDPYGVLIQRNDGTYTSIAERRNQEKENFAKNLKNLYDEFGSSEQGLPLFRRAANSLSYVDWTDDNGPSFVNTHNMTLADEIKYRNETGQWGNESNQNYQMESMTRLASPTSFAMNGGKPYERFMGTDLNYLAHGLEGLTPSERMAVGSSSGFRRAYQYSAMKQDRIRLAEQDAVAKAATTGSFAGTPWEKNGQTGSLINL